MGLNSKHHHHKGFAIHMKRLERKSSHLFNKKVAPTLSATTDFIKPLSQTTVAIGSGLMLLGTVAPPVEALGGALVAGGTLGLGISSGIDQAVNISAKTEKGEDTTKDIEKFKQTTQETYKTVPSTEEVFSLFI